MFAGITENLRLGSISQSPRISPRTRETWVAMVATVMTPAVIDNGCMVDGSRP